MPTKNGRRYPRVRRPPAHQVYGYVNYCTPLIYAETGPNSSPAQAVERPIKTARNPQSSQGAARTELLHGVDPIRQSSGVRLPCSTTSAAPCPRAASTLARRPARRSASIRDWEWLAALVLDPENALAFLGTQGDVFDAQKDAALALLGSLLALVVTVGARARS